MEFSGGSGRFWLLSGDFGINKYRFRCLLHDSDISHRYCTLFTKRANRKCIAPFSLVKLVRSRRRRRRR